MIRIAVVYASNDFVINYQRLSETNENEDESYPDSSVLCKSLISLSIQGISIRIDCQFPITFK